MFFFSLLFMAHIPCGLPRRREIGNYFILLCFIPFHRLLSNSIQCRSIPLHSMYFFCLRIFCLISSNLIASSSILYNCIKSIFAVPLQSGKLNFYVGHFVLLYNLSTPSYPFPFPLPHRLILLPIYLLCYVLVCHAIHHINTLQHLYLRTQHLIH